MIIKKTECNLFIVILKYTSPVEKIDEHREAHWKFLDRYYQERILIVSGPQVPCQGGVIIARCESKDLLKKILAEDPFIVHKLATQEIYEFVPRKSLDDFIKDLQ